MPGRGNHRADTGTIALSRHLLAGVCAVALVLTTGGTAGAAAPADAGARLGSEALTVGGATLVDLGIDDPSAMIRVGSRLFVSAGDEIRVYSLTGKLAKIVTGQAGVRGLVASPDGATVYAALRNASAVSAIDTSTLVETGRTTNVPCVTYLAMSATSLFASYGCAQNQASVGYVDPVARTVTVAAGSTWYSPPQLAAVPGRLAVRSVGISPATLESYTVSGSTATKVATALIDNSGALAFRPDGSRLAVGNMGPYELEELDPDTLTQLAAYPTGPYPASAAYSADGSKLIGGQDTTYDADLIVFSTATGSALTRRQAVVPSSSAGEIASGTTVFGPDGTYAYGLAVGVSGSDTQLAMISTSAPRARSVTLTLGSYGYGAKLPVKVKVSGGHAAKVVLSLDGTEKKRISVGSSGAASTTLPVTVGGSVKAQLTADADFAAASTTRSFKAPTRSSVSMSGAYKTRSGVKYFRRYQEAQLLAQVRPAGTVTVQLYSQTKRSGRWVTTASVSLTTDFTGRAYAHLLSASKNTLYRTYLKFPATGTLKASSRIGPQYRIG